MYLSIQNNAEKTIIGNNFKPIVMHFFFISREFFILKKQKLMKISIFVIVIDVEHKINLLRESPIHVNEVV